ncbi:MAG: GDP-mannose 4,6-dehydratase, partial [Planctomycetes bacterium]|nr:GDP-mannose 4,6-dehydratase [Planctomycetota bacterium]
STARAASHDRFRAFPALGEERYPVFLAVPVPGASGPGGALVVSLHGDALLPKMSRAERAAYRRGEIDRIRCGRLDHRRDYVDVGDAVAGYQLLLEHGRPNEVYNVCSGCSRQMGDLLQLMLQAAEVAAPIETADDRPQAGDVVDVYGDPRKTVVECGWSARTPIQRSLSEMLSVVPVMSA